MAQLGGVELTNIVALPDGYLAIGAPYGGSAPLVHSPGRPSLWRSSDRLTWRRLPDSPAFVDPKSGWYDSIASVTEGSSSLLVAVGSANNGDASAFDAAAWISTDDGVTWRPAIVDGASDAAMNDVTSTPNGFVAVGIDGHPSGATQMIGSRGAAVWTSRDGSHWSRVPTEPAFAGAEMGRVMGTGSSLVATGSDNPTGTAKTEPPIWHSTDALHWTRASTPLTPGTDSFQMAGVLWTGSEFVVVGGEELGNLHFAWTSSDGQSWARTDVSLAWPGSERGYLRDLASSGSTMLLFGPGAQTTAGGTEAMVWESTDGRAWQAIPTLPLFENALPMRAVYGPAGLVVLTADQSNESSIWLATR